jgi:23S rRNA pseudouridine955/2504/2580 synthase
MPNNHFKIKSELLKNKIYEDENILVLNKPANLAVQGGSKVQVSVDQLFDYRLTHRIDKDTSGILILAKNQKIAASLIEKFKFKKIWKTYLAIIVGRPKKLRGKISLPIYNEHKGKQAALTEYEVIDYVSNELSFIALYPITGRKHQLRIHLKNINCPILGDGKYGGKEAFKNNLHNKIHLHAYKIEIDNYLGKKMTFTADIPYKFKESMDLLGFNESLL